MRMASGKLVPVSKPFGSSKVVVRKLLIALSYYEGDREAAEDLATLIADLERTRNREADILLMRRNDAREVSAPVKAKLELKFDRVRLHVCRRTDARGYPHAPNQMFADLAALMAHSAPFATDYYAWLNLETDVVPTRPGWIGELSAAWHEAEAAGKSALGFIHDNPTPHLNGMAIYAPDIMKRIPQLLGSSPQVCYDIWHASRVLPVAEPTPLIYFSYRQPTITPGDLFAVQGAIAPCLYHGVKDGSARSAVRARFVTFTDQAKPVVILHKSEQTLKMTELQDPTTFSVPSLGAPVSGPDADSRANPINRPNVYTYSHKHEGVTKPELAAILAAWSKGWMSRGWNPVVLTLRDAAKHTRFDDFSAAIDKLPCVGDQKRMAHRFYRWLALDVVGGGLLTDYDVLPLKFTEAESGGVRVFSESAATPIFGAFLTKDASATWIEDIMRYDAQPGDQLNGKPHVSDSMIADEVGLSRDHTTDLNHVANFGLGRKSVAMEQFLEAN